MRREAVWWLTWVVCLAAIVGGPWARERYETTAGPDDPVDGSVAVPAPGRWRLTSFVRPRCPSAWARVAELAEVRWQAPELAMRVVFVRPPGTHDGVERASLWDVASRLAGVELTADDGRVARRHGAETSGVVVLTGLDGRAVFRGGRMRARGREGEGAGRRAVLD